MGERGEVWEIEGRYGRERGGMGERGEVWEREERYGRERGERR